MVPITPVGRASVAIAVAAEAPAIAASVTLPLAVHPRRAAHAPLAHLPLLFGGEHLACLQHRFDARLLEIGTHAREPVDLGLDRARVGIAIAHQPAQVHPRHSKIRACLHGVPPLAVPDAAKPVALFGGEVQPLRERSAPVA
ncbi:MAG TPA: hypothetical protein VMH61_05440, partial [Candidatus Acidoferrales bacterium]|nr:hypothetical protein [Candidatus Acidoferrales bacterium]